jgi:hypothetical protein
MEVAPMKFNMGQPEEELPLEETPNMMVVPLESLGEQLVEDLPPEE